MPRPSLAVLPLVAILALSLAGCSRPYLSWKSYQDVNPNSTLGREAIVLRDLERIQDAKQEWVRETGAPIGSGAPDLEVLSDRYLRRYEYGRRAQGDDDTKKLPLFTPIHPGDGEYIVGRVGENPKSSVYGDLLKAYDRKVPRPEARYGR
jgi:hypothetical protein